MVNEINILMERVRKFSEVREWGQFHNPKDLAIALVLEANEVLELFRFKQESDFVCEKEIAKELADVLNIVLRMADVLGIDLIYWFDQKMRENEQKYPVEHCCGKNLKYNEINKEINKELNCSEEK
ncbi:nucleotide pyrophosphohydrolase [Candidatus Woesearchaeota archaeon]|nr:nucleotide pyrophosphohydrolase [Candidatus Woesearchaeota archaeon]MBT6520158.1 nucleotide pyrophosphohydrolase [Candidatus Woesearchaeota archaeon]MBT7366763.1 nucleotide pyrophosphohydrolase [Candidatus Woesearchaeota archaeon]